ncbi:tryptophan 2,3-dioxygenase isoform X1 [Strongylocentrotus purpuratus]|uniref:Tryptophan 2,3-dioxygenase n=2 Tax=Strongylocentrotus purpuratus TaxID=7668 RepID=A0A7M7NII2_STRPU|nr:tryptophan 2,3-dioxygenase isoform X1 [Strongylocentrotus purpuratus]
MSCPFGGGGNRVPKGGTGKDDDKKLTYGSYLQLDKLLSCVDLQSAAVSTPVHDEHLFIVTHQAYELWFKQILFEVNSIIDLLGQVPVDEKKQLVMMNRLERIVQILKLLVDQIYVLETMTPLSFSEFRDYLSPASGFQSFQFRLLENKLGLKPGMRVSYQRQNYASVYSEELQATLKKSEEDPTLLNVLERWLERCPGLEEDGFNFWEKYNYQVRAYLNDHLTRAEAAESEAQRDQILNDHKSVKETFDVILDTDKYKALLARGDVRISHKALQGALLISHYREEVRFHQPFQFMTRLMDIDSLLTKWRYNHVMMVQRMIGSKPGSGGSSGYHYLRSTVSDRYKVFLDLFNLSNYLLPRNYIPPLTPGMKRTLSIPNLNTSVDGSMFRRFQIGSPNRGGAGPLSSSPGSLGRGSLPGTPEDAIFEVLSSSDGDEEDDSDQSPPANGQIVFSA